MSTEVPKPTTTVDNSLVQSDSEIQDPSEIERVYQKEGTQNRDLEN